MSNFFCAPPLIVTSYSKWTLMDMILASKWIQLEAYVGLILNSPSYGTVHQFRWTWSDGEIVNCSYDISRWVGRFAINRKKRMQYDCKAKLQLMGSTKPTSIALGLSSRVWFDLSQPQLLDAIKVDTQTVFGSQGHGISALVTINLNSESLAKML